MSTSFPPIIHMFSTGRFRRAIFAGVLVLRRGRCSGTIRTGSGDDLPYRFPARRHVDCQLRRIRACRRPRGDLAADRRQPPPRPTCRCSAFHANQVDWDRTDAYADAARAARYAETSGPTTSRCSTRRSPTPLNDIEVTTDPTRKVAMALEARQNVMRWAAEHYGYRAPRRRQARQPV